MEKKENLTESAREKVWQFSPEESSFRIGYFHGVNDTIKAFLGGGILRRLINYYNEKLLAWHYQGDYSKDIVPPEMPKVRK